MPRAATGEKAGRAKTTTDFTPELMHLMISMDEEDDQHNPVPQQQRRYSSGETSGFTL